MFYGPSRFFSGVLFEFWPYYEAFLGFLGVILPGF